MVCGQCLVGVPDAEQRPLVGESADQLQAEWEPFGIEAGGQRQGGQHGDVDRAGEPHGSASEHVQGLPVTHGDLLVGEAGGGIGGDRQEERIEVVQGGHERGLYPCCVLEGQGTVCGAEILAVAVVTGNLLSHPVQVQVGVCDRELGPGDVPPGVQRSVDPRQARLDERCAGGSEDFGGVHRERCEQRDGRVWRSSRRGPGPTRSPRSDPAVAANWFCSLASAA